jgi:hypothetical protein
LKHGGKEVAEDLRDRKVGVELFKALTAWLHLRFDNSMKTKIRLRVRAAGLTPHCEIIWPSPANTIASGVWRDVQRDPPTCAVVELLANNFTCE